ncbi:MAG: transcription termination/antitermination protein NusG [Patescibacteria group bacterium]
MKKTTTTNAYTKPTFSTEPHWYVVQTYVGFEDVVKDNLQQKFDNLGLNDKVFEIYIPTSTLTTIKNGKRKQKEQKVYPGYLYVHMILDEELAYTIQSTQYVSKIAGTGEFAVALEDGYVESLKQKLANDSDPATQVQADLQIGDLVNVIEGPFKDMTGKISGISPTKDRVNVLLKVFERETNVELDILQVNKAIK